MVEIWDFPMDLRVSFLAMSMNCVKLIDREVTEQISFMTPVGE